MSWLHSACRRLALVAVPLLLAGCAAAPPLAPVTPDLFDDAHFAPPSQPVDAAAVFRLSPAMKDYLQQVLLPVARARGVQQALTEALYTRSKLQLQYDASVTRTAAQAFDARQGNCLSLVIMTGAFANALDQKVTFQQVSTDELWSRSGGMYFLSGHVNIAFQHRLDRSVVYTIDFMPAVNDGLHVRSISEETVLAMYMNNRAAEEMVRGRLDDAYWFVREALRLDPQFHSAYNTLGVVYLQHGDAAHAEQVLAHVLHGAPDNPRILSNYAEALAKLGRADEAQAVQARLAALEPTPPFHWFAQGQAALRRGDHAAARELFLKEIARDPDYHEFHYALAVADFDLGRFEEARRELALARDDAVKRSDHDLYAAKLDHLRGGVATLPAQAPTVQ